MVMISSPDSFEALFPETLSLNGRLWQMRSSEEREALTIAQRFDLPLVLAHLLTARGISLAQTDSFLNPKLKSFLPDPSSFKEVDKAVERVVQALHKKEKIAIFGDYDVDGATSSALLYRYLSQLGAEVCLYIPDRLKEGYGLNTPALLKLAAQGVTLVLTVDCGTTAFEPCQEAKKAGLDLIILDHHLPEDKLPEAFAVINPNRLDETGLYGNLAAVGVCFIFLTGLNRTLRSKGAFAQRPEPDLLSLLGLVALGTLCDVMPLTGLNRAFVSQGLKVMAARHHVGMKALLDVGGVKERPTAYHAGFILGPRVNAGGRVGKADLGTLLLTTENCQEAEAIAQTLNTLNQERQMIEQEVLEQAILQAEYQSSAVLICHGLNWHPGVIGIVAGRLKERFNRPALVISVDEKRVGKGSGRSLPGIDLGMLIHKAKQKNFLLAGGGHAMAAGFSIEEDKIKHFHAFLNQDIQELGYDLTPRLTIDAHLSVEGASVDFVRLLDRLAPYGQGNPAPRFLFENLRLLKADIVGQHHIRCLFGGEGGGRLSGICFRSLLTPLGEALLKAKGETFHGVGTLKVDAWQGEDRVQFILEDGMPGRAARRKAS